MDTTLSKKAKTMAELLPSLSGLLSRDAMRTLTATKKPRTTERVMKPLTIAEMRNEIKSLQYKSPRNNVQTTGTAKKKWNSSCKLENKTVSHTASGQMKHNSVRKVLNFQQPKPKASKSFANSRMTMMNSETANIPKPEIINKKSAYLQARNTVRISGICKIPETPVVMNKPIMTRMTSANKENIGNQTTISKKLTATPKSTLRKRIMASRIPDTPLSNESWKSSCDSSFLQNEQDIEYIENKTKALTVEHTLENIAEVSPPMSTPFIDYRNVKEFFTNSIDVDNRFHNNTIMCFDNTISKENSQREESVILSLCDMLNKATVSDTEKHSTELHDLLEVQKQTENNLKMLDNGIRALNNIKESQLKSLQCVNKLIQEKRICETDNKTITETKESSKRENNANLETGFSKSVIKVISKSPSYKIPKKNTVTIKKVICKSMPNISGAVTPQNGMGEKALSMYLKMKERNNYLNTPIVKQMPMEVPDTPAMTSHNLQKQLDKLYDES